MAVVGTQLDGVKHQKKGALEHEAFSGSSQQGAIAITGSASLPGIQAGDDVGDVQASVEGQDIAESTLPFDHIQLAGFPADQHWSPEVSPCRNAQVDRIPTDVHRVEDPLFSLVLPEQDPGRDHIRRGPSTQYGHGLAVQFQEIPALLEERVILGRSRHMHGQQKEHGREEHSGHVGQVYSI